jgi:hypothetical protein
MEAGVHQVSARVTGALAMSFVLALSGASLAQPKPDKAALAKAEKERCIVANETAGRLRNERKLTAAKEQFTTCAQATCPAMIRDDCTQALAELEKKTPSVVVRAKSSDGGDAVDVALSVDGTPISKRLDATPMALDPGVHTFKLEAAGVKPITRQLVVVEGEQARVLDFAFERDVATPPPEASGPKRPFPILPTVVAGVAVLSFAGFATFALMGRSEFDSASASCGPKNGGPGCSPSTVDSIKTKLLVGDIFLGVGVAAAIGATVLYVMHFTKKVEEPAHAGRWIPSVSPLAGGAAASLSTRF